MRKICKECLRPKATDQDEKETPEGEGEYLCWGDQSELQCSEVAQEVTENARDLCVKLQAENERLKAILADLANLPSVCPACIDAGRVAPHPAWNGEALVCPSCGTDVLAYDLDNTGG